MDDTTAMDDRSGGRSHLPQILPGFQDQGANASQTPFNFAGYVDLSAKPKLTSADTITDENDAGVFLIRTRTELNTDPGHKESTQRMAKGGKWSMATRTLLAKDNILIASCDESVTGHYSCILGKNFEIRLAGCLSEMHTRIETCKPTLLFIDPQICPDKSTESLAGLIKKLHGILVVIIDNQTDRLVDERSLFKAGARGFCKDTITPALLSRAVHLVLDGEYWIQRKLITQVISELARESGHATPRNGFDNPLVNSLTPRELQVARMVHLGGNNKLIARELDISERTVKAHLSAIFRKLEIQNRLNLALFFSELS